MTDRASAEGLRDADWNAAFDTLTSGHVFPNDRLSAREQTVFQMTVGYIKRHMRDRLAALRSSESDSGIDALADDVRYAGGNGTSDYWRGFNDGIDALLARLSTPETRVDWTEGHGTIARPRTETS